MDTSTITIVCVLGLVTIGFAFGQTRSVGGAIGVLWGWMRFALWFLSFMVAFALLIAGGIARIIGGAFLLISCTAALHYYLRVVRPLKRITGDPGSLSAADQNDLGITYYNGLGVPQDYCEAMKWFRLAASHGFASAQSSLGVGYVLGHGVPQDYAEAVDGSAWLLTRATPSVSSISAALTTKGTGCRRILPKRRDGFAWLPTKATPPPRQHWTL